MASRRLSSPDDAHSLAFIQQQDGPSRGQDSVPSHDQDNGEDDHEMLSQSDEEDLFSLPRASDEGQDHAEEDGDDDDWLMGALDDDILDPPPRAQSHPHLAPIHVPPPPPRFSSVPHLQLPSPQSSPSPPSMSTATEVAQPIRFSQAEQPAPKKKRRKHALPTPPAHSSSASPTPAPTPTPTEAPTSEDPSTTPNISPLLSHPPTPAPPPNPDEPTEEEMDRFFGYINPDPKPAIVTPAPSPPARFTAAQKGKGRAEPEETGELQRAATPSPLPARDEPASGPAPLVYQLSPIQALSASGEPLVRDEKRLAIIHSLELLALSILTQLVDTTFPPPTPLPSPPVPSSPVTETPDDESAGEVSRSTKTTRTPKPPPPPRTKVIINLLNRQKKVDPAADGEEPVTKATRQISFPSSVSTKKTSRCNGPTLAALLKTLELVLDGLRGNVISTKRDLYYRSVRVFGTQARVDNIIEDLAATLGVRREDLNLVGASKGLFAGYIAIHTKDGKVVEAGGQGALIPPSVTIERVTCDNVKFVLIVEKEAVFQSLNSPTFLRDALPGLHGVLLTGKGYPDLSTRELVKLLSTDYPSLPILCLVDSDPHGLEILSTYKFGSMSLAFDVANLAVPSIEWIGVMGTEWDSMGVPRDELLPLSNTDRTKALKMLKRDGLPAEWRRELSYMLHLQRKAEIQILSTVTTAPSASQSSPSPSPTSSSSSSSSSDPSATPPTPTPTSSTRLFDYLARKITECCSRA